MTLHHTFAVLSNNPLKPFGPSHRILRSLERLKACNRPSLVEHINADGHGAIPLRQIADTLKRLVQCCLVTQEGHGKAVYFDLDTDGVAQLARLNYDVQDALEQQQSDDFIATRNAAEAKHRKPAQAVTLVVNPADAVLLTRSTRHRAASRADLANQALRPGSQAALEHPSRIGDRRHYRDGRVTSMTGEVLRNRK